MAGSASLALFQKNLQDVVKGIRSHHKRGAPDGYISEAFAEIKIELKSTDVFVKAEAVRKLTYLQSIGYNVSWASFAIIEVMSQARFDHKKIGYLAANQSFNENTDLILLTTNLFKKEFVNHMNSFYCIGLALNCLGNIATRDLSRDCINDVLQLMTHPQPYIRKKAIITMYKIYIKFPQGFRITFEQLKARLDDDDGSVVSCAVNVICELAHKNPRNYLAMAPKFFKLLTTSSNNWMLIKVVKLLGSLVSVEPRLARKLLEPLATIVQNTSAKSLQFECIHTVTLALPFTRREDGSDAKNVPAVLNLCLHHLRLLLQDEDPNLKYLGLVGLLSLLKSHPRVVLEQRDLVLLCLGEGDATIRVKALELLVGVVTKKTLRDLVQQLLKHLQTAEGAYRDDIISKILQMGSRGRYALVSDFLWYVSVLQRLACMTSSGCDDVDIDAGRADAGMTGGGTEGRALTADSVIGSGHDYSYDSTTRYSKHGREVADQLMEIALRVEFSRSFVVECMVSLLLNSQLLLQGQAKDTVAEVLLAAAWVVGEYSSVLLSIMLDKKQGNDHPEEDSEEDSEEDLNEEGEDEEGFWIDGPDGTELRSRWRKLPLPLLLVETLLHPRVSTLPNRVQAACLQSSLKIVIEVSQSPEHPAHCMAQIVTHLRLRLPVFLQSVHLEVQERASTFQRLLVAFRVLAAEDEGRGIFHDIKSVTGNSTHNRGSDSCEEHEEEEGDGDCDDIDRTVDDLLIFLPDESISFHATEHQGQLQNARRDATAPGIMAAAQHAHQAAVLGAHPSSADRRGAAQLCLSPEEGGGAGEALKALSVEKFYTVHPKAQRKVPMPVGLDLDMAFDSDALQRVLALVEPEIPAIGDLTFLDGDKGMWGSRSSRYPSSSCPKYGHPSQDLEGVVSNSRVFDQAPSSHRQQGEVSSFDVKSYVKNQEQYYIKSSGITGDDRNGTCGEEGGCANTESRRGEYEDILVGGGGSTEVRRSKSRGKGKGQGKKEGQDKHKKAKRRSKPDVYSNGTGSRGDEQFRHRGKDSGNINRLDLVPGGGMGSDSDNDDMTSLGAGADKLSSDATVVFQRRNGRRKQGATVAASEGVDSDDSGAGLEDIDITRPQRRRNKDMLSAAKHHEAASHEAGRGGQEGDEELLGERDEKRKKKDISSSASVPAPSAAKSKLKSRKGGSKRRPPPQMWIPLYEDSVWAFDVSYALRFENMSESGDGGGQLKVAYRVENHAAPSTAALSISLLLTEVASPLTLRTSSATTSSLLPLLADTNLNSSNSSMNIKAPLPLKLQLAPGDAHVTEAGDKDGAVCLSLRSPEALGDLLDMVRRRRGLSVTLQVACIPEMEETLVDTGNSDVPSTPYVKHLVLVPSLCSFCVPHVVSPEEFSSLLGMSTNHGGSNGQAHTRLAYNCNVSKYSTPKKVCRVVAKYLQSHEVDCIHVGEGRAMSLCSRLANSELTVCILLKGHKVPFSKEDRCDYVSVDVKCIPLADSARGQVSAEGSGVAGIRQNVADAIVAAVDLIDLLH